MATWQGQGLPGPSRLVGLIASWKTFRYIITLNQTHIQYCQIISFFCDTVVWNQTPYDFIIELTNSMDDSYHYFRHLFHGKCYKFIQKAWISTYQEQVKRISSMNSWYEIMVFFMNSCFCVWISTYQEQVKQTSSHEFIRIHHDMNSWCDMNSWYEIMVLKYDFKPLL
jgi:hypothetical protein